MSEPVTPNSRGVLFPSALPPRFRRVPAAGAAADLVAWWWIAEWDGPSEQQILAFPASNLVVERDVVGFSGPTTRASTRTLDGTGWAVGALLRPAAVPSFTNRPAELRDRYLELAADDLRRLVGAHADPADSVDEFSAWLQDRCGDVSEEAHLANRMADVIGSESEVTCVADVVTRLSVSERTVHRLAGRYVGLTPHLMIRRRRLQEAAEHIRTRPDQALADLAAEYGFTDQAHLSREFRTVLGWSPSAYREQSQAG